MVISTKNHCITIPFVYTKQLAARSLGGHNYDLFIQQKHFPSSNQADCSAECSVLHKNNSHQPEKITVFSNS